MAGPLRYAAQFLRVESPEVKYGHGQIGIVVAVNVSVTRVSIFVTILNKVELILWPSSSHMMGKTTLHD